MTRKFSGTCRTCEYCYLIKPHMYERRRHTPPWTTIAYDTDWCGEYESNFEESQRLNQEAQATALEWRRIMDKAYEERQNIRAGAEPLELTIP